MSGLMVEAQSGASVSSLYIAEPTKIVVSEEQTRNMEMLLRQGKCHVL